MEILTQPQIHQFLDTTDGREYHEGVLRQSYEFESFLEAVSFVNDLTEAAEQLAHHPDILIQYNKVTLSTRTHDAEGQITDRDAALVKAIMQLVE